MKKILFTTFFWALLLQVTVHAQETEIRKEFFPNGQMQYERTYKDGKRHGPSKRYHENGNLYQEVMYVDGKKQGTLKQYTANGNLEQTYNYKDDIVEGLVQKFNKDGTLQHEHNFENGMPDRKTQRVWRYFLDGTLKYESSYYYGDGYRKEYHPNGKLFRKFDIKKLKLTNFEEYDKNGALISKQNGEYTGVLSEYDETGKIVSQKKIMNGRLARGEVGFHENSETITTTLKWKKKHPYIGFWKTDCSHDFGIAINRSEDSKYSVIFCGPSGCFEEGFYLPNSTIENDPKYRVIDSDTLEIIIEEIAFRFKRCTPK
ncbi:MAG: toxin-antitoxin system YwqK family antitoxin [Candidatus Omnitrophota bacterium]